MRFTVNVEEELAATTVACPEEVTEMPGTIWCSVLIMSKCNHSAYSLFLHRSIGISAPLRPASHENFDFGITSKFQSKSLDRGSSTGLSVTHRRLVGHYSSFAEKLLQLRFRFESTVFGDKFFPFEMRRAGNATTSKFTVTASIDDLELV